jgi:hypothetical protein
MMKRLSNSSIYQGTPTDEKEWTPKAQPTKTRHFFFVMGHGIWHNHGNIL